MSRLDTNTVIVATHPRRLVSRLFYLWRLLATGLSFVLFGLGGTLISLLLSLSVYLAPLEREVKQRCSRRVICGSFRLYIGLLRRLNLLTFETHGMERLQRGGQLIIANHPSLLDVVFLLAFVKQADCVVKGSLWRNPFTFGPVTAAGFIRNDDANLVERCAQSLRRGNSLIIFPEGTRTVPGRPLRLLRGAANIALAAGVNLSPVAIRCEPVTLLKREKWYRIPGQPPHYTFTALEDIEIHSFLATTAPQCKRARRLTACIQELFTEHARGAFSGDAGCKGWGKNKSHFPMASCRGRV